jgi:hypothetical protein
VYALLNGAKGKNAMPKLENDKEILDPVVLAAMIEDPDEDEDTKQLRKDILGSDETVNGDDLKDDEDEDEDEEKSSKKPKSDDTDEEDDDEGEDLDEDDENAGKPKKPVEAKGDEDEDEDEDLDEDEQPKLTRKQKRQQRSQSFIDEIRKDNARNRRPTQIPDYKPVDYKAAPEEGFKPDELAEDRDRYGATKFVEGAETVRYWAEQDRFWGELGTEAKILAYDPKLNFLVEQTPDGKKNPNFDPDKTAEINEMYFQLVGLKQFQKTNAQGQPLFDRTTGLPLITSTVDRPDISYEKFARKYVGNVSKWNEDEADDRVETARKNITSQKKRQGVRPGGGTRKTLGALKPGDITRMSDEELEKNSDEIERQILEML